MNFKLVFLLSVVFVLVTSVRIYERMAAPDSIEVKGKAFSDGKNVYCGDITVTRGNQCEFHVPTDTVGNFSFKIPANRSDTNKVIVHLHYSEKIYSWSEGTESYTIEALERGIVIITTNLFAEITHCGVPIRPYFDPPGTTTFSREQINNMSH